MLQLNAMRERMENMVRQAQGTISEAIERLDGKCFDEDIWIRPEGGGGVSRVLQNGNVFEKAGVNFSAVEGTLSHAAMRALKLGPQDMGEGEHTFFATGISIVIHPHNPMVPTVHANYRYFELDDGISPGSWWFGGGSDLTPAYLFEEDAMHFHRILKRACDTHDPTFYARFKKTCDEYFYLPHRGESRGVGGIFFDHMNDRDRDSLFAFEQSCVDAFLPSYLPIVEKRKEAPFTSEQKQWQQLRRGRYVEFNLIYDRGTAFGLKTGGRAESILMSLPLTAAWEYDHELMPESPEARVISVLQHPRQWL